MEVIHIEKNFETGKYECRADIKREHFEKVCDDILMAAAWAETVADYYVSIGD